jgi:hypothetical protein
VSAERAQRDALFRRVFGTPDGRRVLAELAAAFPATVAEVRRRIDQAEADERRRVLIGPGRYLRSTYL